jgi:hypothetical protein
MGVVVWPMVEFEADDALAAAAVRAAADPRVERVVICTPDKDLAQCVRGTRIVQLNRRTRITIDDAGVVAKFGVPPASIPDYLALVGDAADGYPGLRGWGAKSTAAVLARFGHIEDIPADWRTGASTPPAPPRSPPRSRRIGRSRCSFARWPRCAPTRRPSTAWTIWNGRGRGRSSPPWPRDSRRPPAVRRPHRARVRRARVAREAAGSVAWMSGGITCVQTS